MYNDIQQLLDVVFWGQEGWSCSWERLVPVWSWCLLPATRTFWLITDLRWMERDLGILFSVSTRPIRLIFRREYHGFSCSWIQLGFSSQVSRQLWNGLQMTISAKKQVQLFLWTIKMISRFCDNKIIPCFGQSSAVLFIKMLIVVLSLWYVEYYCNSYSAG